MHEGKDAPLGPNDPPPAIIENPAGRAPFLLIGDHAGDVIPARLGTMGVSAADRARHIALDIGVAALGARLAADLDAVFIRQRYSRLVIDCNRDPDSAEAVPAASDGTAVPGNIGLDAAARAGRVTAIHAPYQAAIGAEVARRAAAGLATVLVSLHSFTPVMAGFARPWQAGVLFDGGETGFARRLLARLEAVPCLTIGDNEPYRMDATDHTVPRHAYPARLPYAELEIRQDELGDEAGVARWAATLGKALGEAL